MPSQTHQLGIYRWIFGKPNCQYTTGVNRPRPSPPKKKRYTPSTPAHTCGAACQRIGGGEGELLAGSVESLSVPVEFCLQWPKWSCITRDNPFPNISRQKHIITCPLLPSQSRPVRAKFWNVISHHRRYSEVEWRVCKYILQGLPALSPRALNLHISQYLNVWIQWEWFMIMLTSMLSHLHTACRRKWNLIHYEAIADSDPVES